MRGVLFWFTTVLKDPKAVIPDAQVAHFRASSYDSRWLGKTVEVRGTVSHVDLRKGFRRMRDRFPCRSGAARVRAEDP
jgi:hypothetical protein